MSLDPARPGRFVCEAITPVPGTITVGGLAGGTPGIPGRFRWRRREYVVATVVEGWKAYRPEGHVRGGDLYLRKHWFTLVTTTGERMTVYCDRAPRNPKRPKARWWLHTIDDAAGAGSAPPLPDA